MVLIKDEYRHVCTMKRKIAFVGLIVLMMAMLLFLTGCAQAVEDVKSDKYLDETVMVRGTVEGSVKIGDFAGYILEDSNGDSIGIVSDSLPAEGDTVTVRGTLKKNIIFGYYIDSEE